MKHSLNAKATSTALILFALLLVTVTGCKKKENVKQPETEYKIKEFKVMDSETGSYDSVTSAQPYFTWEITPETPEGTSATIRIAEMKQGEKEEDALKARGKDITIANEIFDFAPFVRYSLRDYVLQPHTRYAVSFTVNIPGHQALQFRSEFFTHQFFKPKVYFKTLYSWAESAGSASQFQRLMLAFEWNEQNNYEANLVKYKIVKAYRGNAAHNQTVGNATWRLTQLNAAVSPLTATGTESRIVWDWRSPTNPSSDDYWGQFATALQFDGSFTNAGAGWVYIVALKYNDQEWPGSIYTTASSYLPFY